MDASLRTNPRMPMIAELVDLLRAGFAGRYVAAGSSATSIRQPAV